MRIFPAFLAVAIVATPAGNHPGGVRIPQSTALTPRDSALHALNRLAYGPRPGEVDRVAALGVMTWIERQLYPDRIADPVVAERERAFPILDEDPASLARALATVRQQRLAAGRRGGDSMAGLDPRAVMRIRRAAGQLQQLDVVRAVLSERQLREVMVDFWTNHFNVFFAKGADRAFTPSYIEHTIRPHVLGRFSDLLVATAQSPAMLFYLDNWQSVAPGAVPPAAARLARLPDSMRQRYWRASRRA